MLDSHSSSRAAGSPMTMPRILVGLLAAGLALGTAGWLLDVTGEVDVEVWDNDAWSGAPLARGRRPLPLLHHAAQPAGGPHVTTGKWSTRSRGQLFIPVDGSWSLFLTSDDAGVLSLDGRELIDLGGQHHAITRFVTVELRAGWHSFVLDHAESGHGAALDLRIAPGAERPGAIPRRHLMPAEVTPRPWAVWMRVLGGAAAALAIAALVGLRAWRRGMRVRREWHLATSDLLRWAGYTLFIAVLACLAVNRFAPMHLDADGVLPSLMSLKHVTVFYWEQDRFANVVPALVSWIDDPTRNLLAMMLVYAAAFFWLVLLAARFMSRGIGDGRTTFTAFALLLGAVGLVFTPLSSAAYMLSAQPYAPSYALLAAGAASAFSTSPLRFLVLLPAIFLATGLNTSVILPCAVLVFGIVAVERRWLPALQLSVVQGAMFFAWQQIAKPYRTDEYNYYGTAGEPDRNIFAAIAKAEGFIRPLHAVALIFLCGSLFALRRTSRDDRLGRILVVTVVGAVLYFAVVSQNSHVLAMGSVARYFFPVWFAMAFVVACLAYQLVVDWRSWLQRLVGAACVAGYVYWLAQPFVAPRDYAVFARVRSTTDTLADRGVQFVAGDYWRAWPVVHALMSRGKPAHGLPHRAEGDRDTILRALDEEERRNDAVTVACVGHAPEVCAQQLTRVAGDTWRQVLLDGCGEACRIMRFSRRFTSACRPPTCLDWKVARYPEAPTASGRFANGTLVGESRQGWLVFGTYARMVPGAYRLRITGRVTRVEGQTDDGVWVDVVHRRGGSTILAKTPIRPDPPSGLLLDEPVTVGADVTDLEIRVWTEGRVPVVIEGYALAPVPAQ